MKKMFISILLILLIVFSGTAMCDVQPETDLAAVYSAYRAGDSAYASPDFKENAATMIGGMQESLPILFERYPDFEILLLMERDEYHDVAIEGTQYSLTAQELEAFDAVMVCSRSCDNWQIVEFAGFVRGGDGVSRITYSEILMDKVTLISGRMIGLGDACKIMNHLSDNGKETSAGLFSYLVGSLYNDIDTAKYLHSSELEACLQDVEKKFDTLGNVKSTYELSRGSIRLLSVKIHIYASEPISLELHYLSNVKTNTPLLVQREEAELHKALLEDCPELGEDFPFIMYLAYDSSGELKCGQVDLAECELYNEANLGL